MLFTDTPFHAPEFLTQSWHWSFSGAMIALVLFLLTWMGKSFGISTSFQAACTALGAGKKTPFFRMNLKDEFWRFAFVGGAIAGGALTAFLFDSTAPVAISDATIGFLKEMGMSYPESDHTGRGFIPTSLLNFSSISGVLIALAGGFLVGFGARYARGCTSGHGITGLAHLQLPSLLTVIGFFIGGLFMTHLILPLVLPL